ncbi:MAG TPA: DUF4230 domain-containing protein [Myxococcales bacterium]|nr:DUF4230 domain-containing protein [Myxococcales bacterium]
MRNLAATVVACVLAAALGAGAVWHFSHRDKPLPDPPALVVKVRQVARLQSLDVSLYKKVTFAPDPRETGTVWGDLMQWASYSLRPPRGRAIVFAVAHLSLDLTKLDPSSLRVTGRRVEVVLPAVQVEVELKPAETEIIGSNLDSKETAQLFELARSAFEREVAADEKIKAQARASAEQSLRGLFVGLGFTEVEFLKELRPLASRG